MTDKNIPIEYRHWFQDACRRIAMLIIEGCMTQKTPHDSYPVIESQLMRAYRRGHTDGKAE